MEIDRDAPVIAQASVQVHADRETVWDVLSDFARWPTWNEEIHEMSAEGPLAPGTEFAWRAGPGLIRSRLIEVDPPREIGWSGRTFGVRAVDLFRLEERDGGTLVVEEESWDGFPARFLKQRLRHMLQDAIEKGLHSLKVEAERRAAERRAA